MKNATSKYGIIRQEKWLVLLLALLIFMSCISTLNYDCNWGDDFAAYLNQGIAIAEGRFEQQVALNAYMHPTTLPEECRNSDLVYSWGYSLIEAAVYKLVGFDRVNYESIIYYKLISFVAIAIFSSILYLFFRRRFGKACSFFLCFILCIHPYLKDLASSLYSDIVFLLFSWLCFFFAESMTFKGKSLRSIVANSILFGVCMWATNSIRLNGFTVIIVAALLHLKSVVSERKQFKPLHIIFHLIPYFIFAFLTIIFNYLIFAPATPNLSDLKRISVFVLLSNIKTYIGLIATFLLNLVGLDTGNYEYNPVFWIMLLMLIYGLFRAWKREFILIAFTFCTFLTLIFLPYTQGMRYFINTFPIFMLLFGYSIGGLKEFIQNRFNPDIFIRLSGWTEGAAFMLSVVLFFSCWSNNFFHILQGNDVRGYEYKTAYSSAAVEAYRYIQENTPEDCIIAYSKPRALYLNTERVSFNYDSNGHSLNEADYFFCRSQDTALPLEVWESGMLQLVWTNNEFSLFSVN